MCPLCLGTAALLASGGTSAGGLAALLLSKPLRKRRAPQQTPHATASLANSVKKELRSDPHGDQNKTKARPRAAQGHDLTAPAFLRVHGEREGRQTPTDFSHRVLLCG